MVDHRVCSSSVGYYTYKKRMVRSRDQNNEAKDSKTSRREGGWGGAKSGI